MEKTLTFEDRPETPLDWPAREHTIGHMLLTGKIDAREAYERLGEIQLAPQAK